MLKKLLITTYISVLISGFMLFNCNPPEPPPGPDEANVTLLLKDSNGKIDRSGSIVDSVDKEVQIGIVLYLTQYLDSAVIRVILDGATERVFSWAYKKNLVDTVFFPVMFTKSGTHVVKVTGYITDQPNSVAEGKIIIYGSPHGYTIKFDKNDSDATGTMAVQTINSGDSAKLAMNTFVKAGSHFAGWMTSPTGTDISYADGTVFTMGTSAITFYAKWTTMTTFALTINAANGSVSRYPDAAVYDSGSTVGLKAKANSGYKFVNWSGDTTGTTDSIIVTINKVLTITANFSSTSCNITFKSQGTTYSTATVNYNALATEPAAPQGGACDSFAGWYTSGTYTTKWNFLTDKVTTDTTLFAKWTRFSYSVTYNANGATSGNAPAQQTKTCDGAITLAENSGNLTKTGCTFSGWNTTANGTGTNYASGATYTVNAPLALFALWKTDSLIVTFNSNSGSTVASAVVAYGVTVQEPTAPTKAGSAFAGWYANQALTTPFDFSTAITAARTLYAKWNPVYNVVYNANGGNGSVPVDNNEYTSGQLVTILGKPTGLTRQYYDFTGWNTATDGTGVNRLAGTTFQMGSKNDTLYANWKVTLPVITVQPVSVNPYPFDTISFSVTAEGIGLSYQWEKDGVVIPTATSSTLAKQKVTFSDSGFYSCKVSNSSGSTTSSTVKFAIKNTVKDIDGNEYLIVVIGDQVWTAENLRTTRFNDGNSIPLVTDDSIWSSLTTPAYCFYNNNTNPFEQKKWGALYNWYVVGTNKLAPSGWHVPSFDEWMTLEKYITENVYKWDRTTFVGKSMASKTDWSVCDEPGTVGNDPGKNNSSGFSGLPGGNRATNFGELPSRGSWWSSSSLNPPISSWADAYNIFNCIGQKSIGLQSNSGFSIRLVKN
jgi:uncharacterized protein (TIGR02145 family)/uncharacterized repeat protein (TIGR02543 family)